MRAWLAGCAAVLAAGTVAGMNYRLTLRVKVGDDVRRAGAAVWSRPWLDDEQERNQLTAWRFLDEAARDHAPAG